MNVHNMCYPVGDIVDLVEYEAKYSEGLHYSTVALIMVACIVGLTGNAVVIFFTLFIIKKSKSKIWFLNLAIDDFASLLFMPLQGFALLNGNWTFGPFTCKIFLFVMCTNMYASIFILLSLNISRVLSVAKPMLHRKFISQRVSCWICAAIRVITMLSCLPVLYFGREFKIGEAKYCTLISSKDFNNESLDPVYNLTIEHLNLPKDLYLEINQKYRHFFTTCTLEQCCCSEDTIASLDYMEYSIKWFNIPLLIIGYFLPLFVLITSNITIVTKVKKSHTVNTRRLYRIVITVIVAYFVTWTPAMLADIILLAALINRDLIMVFKVIIFLPFLCNIAFLNHCLNPIIYVLVGRQARTNLSDFLSSLRSR